MTRGTPGGATDDKPAKILPSPKIILTMIVKNESKVIRRCLYAALPFVDAIVVCDTGSDDETPDIIRTVAKAHGKPLHLIRVPWKDFGHNRTLSALFAREYAKEQDDLGSSAYLLFLDADMVFVAPPRETWPELTEPAYNIQQRESGSGLDYPNLRLARLTHVWRSVSVTHEFWAATPDVPAPAHAGWLWIEDIGDGGAKADKFERDIRLLTQGIVDEPTNPRYQFYLGESYFNSGRFAECIPHYERRRAMGAYYEEVWYSGYKIGKAHLELSKPQPILSHEERERHRQAGVSWLLRSYQEDPKRVEPLVALAQHFRERGENHLALMCARKARGTEPETNRLFVERYAYTQALEEIAISAFYTGDFAEGKRAAEELLERREVPAGRKHNAALCASFYLTPIGPHATRRGLLEVSEGVRKRDGLFHGLEQPSTTEYLCSNPSMVEWKGKILTNVRLVNYYHERGRVFASKDPDQVIRTRNVLQWFPMDQLIGHDAEAPPLDSDGQLMSRVLSETELHVEFPEGWDVTTRVRGLEDLRLCTFNGDQLWFTATCFNLPGAGGMPRVVLGRIDERVRGWTVEHLVALGYEGTQQYEKNWLPWDKKDGKFRVIYGYDPFTVLLVDTATGACTVESRTAPPWDCSRFRGSGAPVHVGDMSDIWLALVHETAWFEGANAADQRTVYMHRFLLIDGDKLVKKSPLFSFDHTGVEYAPGLVALADPTGMQCMAPLSILIAHSLEESSAHWKEFPFRYVLKLLNS